MNEQQFREVSKARRVKLGLSQRALAERLKAFGISIDATAITRFERGQRDLRLREAVAIASLLDISLSDLTVTEAPILPVSKADPIAQIRALTAQLASIAKELE